jgi:hypothetical protein
MNRRLPPLNSLKAFEAAARLGSFNQAAEELHVTHGAVSRHVQLLEEWLGAAMFRRLNRRVVLTEAGKAYLAEVGAAFDRIALATSHHVARGPARLLRVSATATLTLRWLIPRLSSFQINNLSCPHCKRRRPRPKRILFSRITADQTETILETRDIFRRSICGREQPRAEYKMPTKEIKR